MTLDDLRTDLKSWARWKQQGEGGYICPLALIDALRTGGFGSKIPRSVAVPGHIQQIMQAMDAGKEEGGAVSEAIAAVQAVYLVGCTQDTAAMMDCSYTTLCARRREGELFLLGRLRSYGG